MTPERHLLLNARLDALLSVCHGLPGVFLYAKDAAGRFVYLNRMAWEGLGVRSEAEALGRTDADFHPPAMAAAYRQEDLAVMADGPVMNRVWLVHNLHFRLPQWMVSSKAPLVDADGRTVGIVGAMHLLESTQLRAAYFQELEPAIRHLEQHFSERINMDDVAKLIPCSRTQLNRRFQTLLHQTPTDFLAAQRVQAARRMLAHSDAEIAEVAYATGFCDQSHFTRRFRAVTGQTPATFRRLARAADGIPRHP